MNIVKPSASNGWFYFALSSQKRMHKAGHYLLLVFVLCFTHVATAQQFGGNPSSVHWKQINTDTVRIIFPEGLERTANRVAAITHALQRNYSGSIGSRIQKINIVLQNDVTISNAYVQLAPYRSEFYLMPPQNTFELGAQHWADNLAIHEFRHVQQYSNFNVGFSKQWRFCSVKMEERWQTRRPSLTGF